MDLKYGESSATGTGEGGREQEARLERAGLEEAPEVPARLSLVLPGTGQVLGEKLWDE